jgi:hypothetical protein
VPTVTAPAAAPVAAAPTTPAELLQAADAAIEAGELARATVYYERVATDHPAALEAGEARRALRILRARSRYTPALVPPLRPPDVAIAGPSGNPGEVVIRQEPYSLRTSERLRLTTWEKLDFGVTSFLYGMSVGFSYGIGLEDGEQTAMAVAVGATVYTLGAVAYLSAGNPDRGDLPLALAITSYLPTTVLLVANIAYDNPDAEKTALVVATTGVLAVPLAIAAGRRLDLDPGDTQLVRDAGFWGLMLGTIGTLGFGGKTVDEQFGGYYQEPSGRTVASVAAVGLYSGLALGALAAANSEISLERVRVSTWGGYGGAVLGAILGATGGNGERGLFGGVTIGAALGLTITFLTTGGLDGIPPPDPVAAALRGGLAPTFMAAPTGDGRAVPVLGIGGRLD